MLTKLTVRKFKRFSEAEIELGNPVVFIGPNNSGKTSAMQALALWEVGVKRWSENRAGRTPTGRGRGIVINRRDLVAIPVPRTKLLWRDLHVRDSQMVDGKQQNTNVRIDIVVEGVTEGKKWECGLEFDYSNEESLICRPLRSSEGGQIQRMPFPQEAAIVQIAFLPPMSGLTATETSLTEGAVNVRIGEGRTAEVLRNLCYRLYEEQSMNEEKEEGNWTKLVRHIRWLFGVELEAPRYIVERGEIAMGYRERGVELDLSSGGRGLQQTMLILAYMYANPGAILLFDEPDAHLEILRQREIYRLITEAADESGGQIIAASHSEVILTEAAKDTVIAFVGRPHRVDDRGSQLLKALDKIGYEHYYQAEQTGWVLYLEGSTDLAILQAFAYRLGHEATSRALARPYVHYVGNKVKAVPDYYYGLKEALPDLKGMALFDRLDKKLGMGQVKCLTWRRREIENYLCSQATLEAYAQASVQKSSPGPLFKPAEMERSLVAMKKSIKEVQGAMETLGKGSPWSSDSKVSDDFLSPLFRAYFSKLGLPNLMNKNDYHVLVEHIPENEIDPEITEKLNAIAKVADSAIPGESIY